MTRAEKEFEGKVALVFAASRGIGKSVALKLGQAGAKVFVGYAGNVEKAEDVANEISKADGEAQALKADVTDFAAVKDAFRLAKNRFGRVDIVINAAGASLFGPLDVLSTEALETMIAVNVRGAFNVLSEAAHEINDNGAIVQFSTGGTKMAVPGGGAYAGTKAAGELMALGLAKELGSRGVRVNVISPGITNTDGLVMPQEQIDMLIQQTPLGRLGELEDVADAVVFLVSEHAHWVTGQNLQANGGIL